MNDGAIFGKDQTEEARRRAIQALLAKEDSSILPIITTLLGGAAGAYFGGPVGAAAGASTGNMVGSAIAGKPNSGADSLQGLATTTAALSPSQQEQQVATRQAAAPSNNKNGLTRNALLSLLNLS